MNRTKNCPALSVLSFISKRWIMLIMRSLCSGTNTFNAIKKELGTISSRTLSERLKDLEIYGLVERRIVSEQPLKIEYHMTKKAKSFHPIIEDIDTWARKWNDK